MAVTWSRIGSRSAKAAGCTGTEAAPAAPVKASVTVAFSSAAAGNTVTVRGVTFTAIANGSTPANTQEFAVGAGGSANTDTGTAFAAAVNANTHRLGCTAVNASGTVTLTANDYGVYANGWTVTKVGDPITLGAATFASGVDYVGVDLSTVKQLLVHVEAAASQTVVNGSLFAWWLNPQTNLWARFAAADIAIGASALRVVGGAPPVTVFGGQGWLAYLPSGVTISASTATVYMHAL